MNWIKRSAPSEDTQDLLVNVYMTPMRVSATVCAWVKDDGSYRVEVRDPWVAVCGKRGAEYAKLIAVDASESVEKAKEICEKYAEDTLRAGAFGNSAASDLYDDMALESIAWKLMRDGDIECGDIEKSRIISVTKTDEGGRIVVSCVDTNGEDASYEITVLQEPWEGMYRVRHKIAKLND